MNFNFITLSFTKEYEILFQKFYFSDSISIFRRVFVFLIFLYGGFGFLDYKMFPEYLNLFLKIRFLIVIPTLAFVLILSYSKIFYKIWQVLIIISLIIGGTGITVMTIFVPDNAYYAGLMLVFTAGYFFIKLRFIHATVACWITLILFNLVSLYFTKSTVSILLHNNFFFVSLNIMGMFAAYNFEYNIRRNFILNTKLDIERETILELNKNLEKTIDKRTKELLAAKEKAEESDHLKTAFLHNMSHEIRTPLNAISGFSQILNEPELSDEKRESFVSIIQNSSNQLLSIVTDILTISSLETKQEKPNISKVCINNIIVDLLSVFKQQSINHNISLYTKKELTDIQSEIYTDKTKITQILSNLLTNALKFTHEGFIEFGYNIVKTHGVETHGRASLQELQFYVKDSGIGINPEFHEKIFERFRQADEKIHVNYGGTGLGLSISKGFAELLGGKIWVQSELEKGSTFYFTIPYKPVNEIDKTKSLTKENENFRTVLVAEDEEYNFLLIEEILSDLDLKLIHAKDGKEAVEICKANPNIDLILMDIKMPIMTGDTAAKIIKELKPDLPIVAQSAYALEHERVKYEGMFDDYLTKPINENDLKQMVIKYVDKQKK